MVLYMNGLHIGTHSIFKEFFKILLGHRIMIYMDHTDLLYTNFDTEATMRQHENAPEVIYFNGHA
jgi:hypothetical protein